MIVLPERIINQFVNNAITKYLYVTDIGYFPEAMGHFRQKIYSSMSNILIYCTRGTGWVSVNGKKENIIKDQYCFIPAGTPHTYAAGRDDPWTIYWVHYSGEHAGRTLVNDHLSRSFAGNHYERTPLEDSSGRNPSENHSGRTPLVERSASAFPGERFVRALSGNNSGEAMTGGPCRKNDIC
jgi:hypothetical protein